MAQYVGAKHVPTPELAVTATGTALVVGEPVFCLALNRGWALLPSLAFLPESLLSCTISGARKIPWSGRMTW